MVTQCVNRRHDDEISRLAQQLNDKCRDDCPTDENGLSPQQTPHFAFFLGDEGVCLGDERFDLGDVFFGGKIARAFIKASDLTGELIEALLKSFDLPFVPLKIALTWVRLSVSVGAHGCEIYGIKP